MMTPFDAVMPIAARPDVVFTAGDGSWITDANGRRYLDFVQGWAVNTLGHTHPAIVEALHRGGAHKIITFENGFHGRTLAMMAASGKPGWDTLFEPKVPGFVKVPYNDLDAVAAAVDDQTVAVMLEPIQGEAGVIPATADFVHGLWELRRFLSIDIPSCLSFRPSCSVATTLT